VAGSTVKRSSPRPRAGALLLSVVILLGFALAWTFIGTRVFNWDDV
jgi:hypothetical protein